mmetsp:Transcript_29043/g.81765  ORF Transcript_29043/g.81765 Transcript_29043/m.81765 type:complete len:262 (-) Transcript_29043:33-818(-)
MTVSNSNSSTSASSSRSTPSTSILVIGASGRVGSATIQALSKHPEKPQVHAFCRSRYRFEHDSPDVASACETIHQGDGKSPVDLHRALHLSGANLILVAIGNGKDDRANDNIRHINAEALVQVLIGNEQFCNVRVYVVSCAGAGSSKSTTRSTRFGFGPLLRHRYRLLIKDHTRQEQTFLIHMQSRVGFIRPTFILTDHASTHKLQTFGDNERPRHFMTNRSDLARWIAETLCRCCRVDDGTDAIFDGRSINICSVRKIKL